MKWLADLRPSYFQGWENQDVSLSNLDTLPEKIIYQRSCLKLHAPGLGRPKACQEGSCGPYRKREPPEPGIHTHLPHGLQLLLLVFVGSLELLHLSLQLLLLSQQLLPQFFPTLAGFFMWWGTAQLQQMDSRMNGYKRCRTEKGNDCLFFISLKCGWHSGKKSRGPVDILPLPLSAGPPFRRS